MSEVENILRDQKMEAIIYSGCKEPKFLNHLIHHVKGSKCFDVDKSILASRVTWTLDKMVTQNIIVKLCGRYERNVKSRKKTPQLETNKEDHDQPNNAART
jgi:hypothetical protein